MVACHQGTVLPFKNVVFISILFRDRLANYLIIHLHPNMYLCTMDMYDTLNVNTPQHGQSTLCYLKQEVCCQPSYDSV